MSWRELHGDEDENNLPPCHPDYGKDLEDEAKAEADKGMYDYRLFLDLFPEPVRKEHEI